MNTQQLINDVEVLAPDFQKQVWMVRRNVSGSLKDLDYQGCCIEDRCFVSGCLYIQVFYEPRISFQQYLQACRYDNYYKAGPGLPYLTQ